MLKQVGHNMTEITTAKGNRILYSYETPVAAYTDAGAVRTKQFYSSTTTKHINKYLGGSGVGTPVDQSVLDGLVN